MLNRLTRVVQILMLTTLAFSTSAFAGPKIFTGWFSDVAIKGYDTVAYFTDGKPVKGSDSFATEWNGAQWHFASAEHRDLFIASPETYAPQYGGHCAYALAKGDLVKIDPEAWSIVDDKLYLNYSPSIRNKWMEDQANFIQKADELWPEIGFE